MRLFKVITLVFLAVGCDTQSGLDYYNKIIDINNELNNKFNPLLDNIQNGRNKEAEIILNEIEPIFGITKEKLNKLGPYKNDPALLNASIDRTQSYESLAKNELKTLIELSKKADEQKNKGIETDGINGDDETNILVQKILNLIDSSADKGREADKKFTTAFEDFKKKYNN